jgi:hypothetical protein
MSAGLRATIQGSWATRLNDSCPLPLISPKLTWSWLLFPDALNHATSVSPSPSTSPSRRLASPSKPAVLEIMSVL